MIVNTDHCCQSHGLSSLEHSRLAAYQCHGQLDCHHHHSNGPNAVAARCLQPGGAPPRMASIACSLSTAPRTNAPAVSDEHQLQPLRMLRPKVAVVQ